MKIVFTGGGTGGHIFPILAIIREIKRLAPKTGFKFYYIGSGDEYALNLLKQEGVKIKKILTGKIRRYFSLKNISDLLFKIPAGCVQAFFWLFFIAPDIVFSKGGYVSFPAAFSAKLLGIPIFLHESDYAPGKTSKLTANWATEIFTSFVNREIFPNNKIVAVGNPIRKEILNGSKEEAKKIFGLKDEKPLIFIWGGSQGAEKINDLILETLNELLLIFEIIHQTGEKNFEKVKLASQALIGDKELLKNYHPYPFLNETGLKHGLAVSDLVVSRAGAGSIFELAGAGKPAIIIPISDSAQDHQRKNGYDFAKRGGGEVIEEKNLTPHFFLEKLRYYFERPDILAEMAKKSRKFSRPRAAEIIASYLIEYLKALKG